MIKKNKLLVLGGKPIGSVELVTRAKELGIYVIVTDYLPCDKSKAKQVADEYWDVSTADVDTIVQLCKENEIDGVLTAVHEFNINRLLDICMLLNKPCYCKRDTWIYCDNKIEFKRLCVKNEIPVAQDFIVDIFNSQSLLSIAYPVIAKPIDGSGSRGFSICHSPEELIEGYNNAKCFSQQKKVLVEKYIPYNATIIHYTMINGKCYYSGMSDKVSCKFKSTGSSVMGIQTFPSKGENVYLRTLDCRVRQMFENAGFTEGPIWIEAFYDGKSKFVFNEMGYRFGGSLTNFPVSYFYGINQLDLLISYAMGISSKPHIERMTTNMQYCILPIHIKPGVVKTVFGVEQIKEMFYVNALVQVHYQGDEIKEWGSAQQVFCYVHILYSSKNELKQYIKNILEILKSFDDKGENMLFTLFNVDTL